VLEENGEVMYASARLRKVRRRAVGSPARANLNIGNGVTLSARYVWKQKTESISRAVSQVPLARALRWFHNS